MLRDYALKTMHTSISQKELSIGIEFFRQPDCAGSILEQSVQQVPARCEFQTGQIVAIEVKQIESVKDRFSCGPCRTPSACWSSQS